MKKLVLVLAIALIAAPLFAAQPITITGTGGVKAGTVGYSGATQAAKPDAGRPSAFALTLTADNGAKFLTVTATKEGESNSVAPGYGIFPGTIYIVGGAVEDYNTPVEPADLPGATGTGLNTSSIVVALGALYSGDGNKPAASGNLFSFTTDKACNVTVAVESLYRGGVVGEDAVAMTVTLPSALVITEPVTETITGTLVVVKDTLAPAIAGRVNAVRSESFTASGVVSSLGHTLEYQFTWGGDGAGSWGAATQTHTFATAITSGWSANVTVQARCVAHPTVLSAASSAITETGEAVRSTATFYADWAAWSRPNCWAYQRQCKGDINGTKQGSYSVFTQDLAALKLAFASQDVDLTGNMICADLNHSKQGSYRVFTQDLAILKLNFASQDVDVPVCDIATVNFWTN